MNTRASAAILGAALFLTSCDNLARRQSRGPIALGDASTIVTETDSQYLQDMVPDPAFDAPATAAAAPDSMPVAVSAPPLDTASNTTSNVQRPTSNEPGLTADFGDVQVILPGVSAREASRSVKGSKAAAYTLSGTGFGGKTIAVRGGTVKRIQQRTGYSAVVDMAGKPALLSDLGTQYTGWQTLQGKGGDYALASAAAPSFNASASTIKTAVQKAARRQRLDRKAEQKLLQSVRGMTSAPLSLVPRAFTWKIDGTDAGGKAFSKEVRIDVPL